MWKIPNPCTDPPLGSAVGFHHVIPLLQPACDHRHFLWRWRAHLHGCACMPTERCSLVLCGRAAAPCSVYERRISRALVSSSPACAQLLTMLQTSKPWDLCTALQSFMHSMGTRRFTTRKGICVSSEEGNSRRNQSHTINKYMMNGCTAV